MNKTLISQYLVMRTFIKFRKGFTSIDDSWSKRFLLNNNKMIIIYYHDICVSQLSDHNTCQLGLYHFGWIYVLTVGEVIELQILHGVYDHHLIHLLHDEPLIEDLMWCSLPTNLMFQVSPVYCVQEILHLKKYFYLHFQILKISYPFYYVDIFFWDSRMIQILVRNVEQSQSVQNDVSQYSNI